VTAEAKAIIYLAAQRGCTQTDWYRSYSTFNFGEYQVESRKPFGAVRACNDDTLKPGSKITFEAPDDISILLLPVVGGVNFSIGGQAPSLLEAGDGQWLFLREGDELEISNPFDNHLVNFLHLWIAEKQTGSKLPMQKLFFDVDLHRNQLQPLKVMGHEVGRIGKYEARAKGKYRVKHAVNGLFIFIIEGAFEVQNRLLQSRDALALWNVEEVDLEALSNEAVILIIDTI
jgi:redox-sensitive bicupin YhaK (pirin superfamily)